MDRYLEEEIGQLATMDDAVREHARNVGMENPDRAWILTPVDIWMPNPFYCGPPVPHPESDDYSDFDDEPDIDERQEWQDLPWGGDEDPAMPIDSLDCF